MLIATVDDLEKARQESLSQLLVALRICRGRIHETDGVERATLLARELTLLDNVAILKGRDAYRHLRDIVVLRVARRVAIANL